MSRVLRKRARVCYYEPEEPSFDEYIFCTSCSDFVYEYCSIHGPLLVIPDDKVLSPTGFPAIVPRAALTIPKVFLHLATSTIPDAGIGVFSTLTLPRGVRFGPYRGVSTVHASSEYCWQVYSREHKPAHVVDARDAARSNWMRYVNCSRHSGEQNLVAFQYQGRIYYRTTKIVPRFTELLVFYGSECALALNVDVRRYRAPAGCSHCIGLQYGALDFQQTGNDAGTYVNASTDKVTEKVRLQFDDDESVQRKRGNNDIGSVISENTEHAGCKYEEHFISNDIKYMTVGTFICDACGKAFNEKALLISHISTHKPTKETIHANVNSNRNLKFPCTSCDSKFATKSERINHDIKIHDSKIKYKACNYCDYKSINSSKLHMHMRTHTGITPYKCTFCCSLFRDAGKLKGHERIHTGEKPYACTICDWKFTTNSSLKIHLRIHTGGKPYQCTICESRFTRNSNLKKHITIHTGVKPYHCTICDSKFTTNTNLKNHLTIHTGVKSYHCTICHSKFTTASYLKRHLMVHSGEKPYQCTICDSKFTRNSSLKNHLLIHTGVKPYQCTICDSKFTTNSNLKRHLTIHTGVKPYHCTICDSKLTTNRNLKNHLTIHTGVKPYQCTICESRFTRNSSLKKHLTIHTGVKPYQCTICESRFTRNCNLKKHLTIHTGVKPYQCTICESRFTRNSNLKKHLTIHTGVKPY